MRSSDIANVSFATTRLHEGYAIPEVDAFLKTVRNAIRKWEAGERGGLVAVDVVNARFTPVKFFKAYNEMQVDDFLDEVVATLAAYESATDPDGGAGEAPGPDGTPAASAEAETDAEPEASAAAETDAEPEATPEAKPDAGPGRASDSGNAAKD